MGKTPEPKKQEKQREAEKKVVPQPKTTRDFSNNEYTIRSGDSLVAIANDKGILPLRDTAKKAIGGKATDNDAALALALVTARKSGITNAALIHSGPPTLKLPTSEEIGAGVASMKANGVIGKDGHIHYVADVLVSGNTKLSRPISELVSLDGKASAPAPQPKQEEKKQEKTEKNAPVKDAKPGDDIVIPGTNIHVKVPKQEAQKPEPAKTEKKAEQQNAPAPQQLSRIKQTGQDGMLIPAGANPVDAAVYELFTPRGDGKTLIPETLKNGVKSNSPEFQKAVLDIISVNKAAFSGDDKAKRDAAAQAIYAKFDSSDKVEQAANSVALTVLLRAEQLKAKQAASPGKAVFSNDLISYNALLAVTSDGADAVAQRGKASPAPTAKPELSDDEKAAQLRESLLKRETGDQLVERHGAKTVERLIEKNFDDGQIAAYDAKVKALVGDKMSDEQRKLLDEVILAANNGLTYVDEKIDRSVKALVLPDKTQIKAAVDYIKDKQFSAADAVRDVANEADTQSPIHGLAEAIKKAESKGK